MKEIYQKINGDEYRSVWAVGDLHGCYTNLMNRLDAVGFDPAQDLLVSVGDLIDRGAENVECLELLTMPWFKAVRGNHEQMMLDGLSEHGNVAHWMSNGGSWFFNLDYDKGRLANALLFKVAELPLIIEVTKGGKKFVICHADYPGFEYEYGKEVDPEQVIWNRERVSCAMDGRWFVGTNGVSVPQQVCPRANAQHFTGYEACKDICRQESHAEVSAINLAGEAARGATIYLEGHFAACPDCQAAADAAGIAQIVIGPPPVQQ